MSSKNWIVFSASNGSDGDQISISVLRVVFQSCNLSSFAWIRLA